MPATDAGGPRCRITACVDLAFFNLQGWGLAGNA